MTPLQFAKAECTNFDTKGACRGVGIGDRGDTPYCSPKPRCVIADGCRCAYFEECVAPMAGIVTEPRHAAEIQTAVREYRQQHLQGEQTSRQCPDCGEPVLWRKRFCPACAVKRRKATFREYKHAIRENNVGMSTVKLKTPSNSLGNSNGFSGFCENPYQGSGDPENGHLTVVVGASGPDEPGEGR